MHRRLKDARPPKKEEENMKKQQNRMMVLAMIMVFMATVLFLPGLVNAGDLEPSAAPGSTMKTLDQIPPTWSQKLQCDGTACPRFELVMGGEAVLDKETGLVWAKDANIASGTKDWRNAIEYCHTSDIGGRRGWRLPTVEELSSPVDGSQSNPALPVGHSFVNVQSDWYWSSTTHETVTTSAWRVYMGNGFAGYDVKSGSYYYVWPVRGGN